MKSNAGESAREVELKAINAMLRSHSLNFQVKEILSDGNCLYRAIADQLNAIDVEYCGGENVKDFAVLRHLAAQQIRARADEFAPFLGCSENSEEFDDYIRYVRCVTFQRDTCALSVSCRSI